MKFDELPAIYIFTNKLNGKVYVGETMNLSKRMENYKHPKGKRPFTFALNKYGLDGFHLEYYYFPNFDKDTLLKLEEETIKRFNSLTSGNGYNVFRRSSNRYGIYQTEEHKRKIGEAQKGEKNHAYGKTGELNSFYGKKHSEETRLKMSKAAKERSPISEETRKKISENSKLMWEIRRQKKSNEKV